VGNPINKWEIPPISGKSHQEVGNPTNKWEIPLISGKFED